MNPYFAPSEAELLAHSSFLEELSCTLVADRQTADDIVQDTWLAVLQHPPSHSINTAGWLRTVANNLARRDRRSRVRQSYRESEVARPEGLPGADEELQKRQALGRVAGAVEALPEPYRTVVFLRFFENLKPGEIAKQLDVGLPTIKSQLHRGLDRLRSDLEEDFGRDGADWRGVLCGCFGWEMANGAPVPIALPATATTLSSKLGVMLAIVLAATTVWLIALEIDLSSETEVVQAALKKEKVETSAPTQDSPREAITTLADQEAQKSGASKLLVTVVDPDGQPVERGTVWVATSGEFDKRGQTDVLGVTTVALRASDYLPPRVFSEMQAPIPPVEHRIGVMATADGFCSSLVSWLELDKLEDGAVTLRLSPHGFSLTGRVIDEDGLPIEGVSVTRHDTREGVQRNDSSDLVVHPAPSVVTDALGRFAFGSLTTGLSWLRFEAAGFAVHWKRRVVREDTTVHLEVTLPRGGAVAGRVLAPDGNPVQGARIWTTTMDGVHEISTLSAENGDFHLEGIPSGGRFVFARGGTEDSLGLRTRLSIKAGEELAWYPRLIQLPEIRINLVSDSGAPLSELPIHMRIRSSSRVSRVDRVTDADGNLSVFEQSTRVERIDFYLTTRYGSVFNFPDAHLDEIVPGDAVHTVVVEEAFLNKGRITFDLLNADQEPFEEVAILAHSARDGVTRRIFVGRGEKSMRASHVVPDELDLIASCTGLGHIEIGKATLRPGETLTLPDVHAQPLGLVLIDWRYPAGGGEEIGIVQHLRKLETKPIGIRVARNEDLTPLESYELLPGDYGLKVFRNRELVQHVRFTIDPGFETLIEVRPEGEAGE